MIKAGDRVIYNVQPDYDECGSNSTTQKLLKK